MCTSIAVLLLVAIKVSHLLSDNIFLHLLIVDHIVIYIKLDVFVITVSGY